MKSVLISIQPKWVGKIASGKKTIEVRKSRPKIETPFKCYIYCTNNKNQAFYFEKKACNGLMAITGSGKGKVIGEFVCDEVVNLWAGYADERGACCLTYDEMENYLGFEKDGMTNKMGYGWHISDLKIYDKPKELSEFYNLKRQPIQRAFQSWGYCYEKEN